MKSIPLIVTLLVASPVFGQSRVYTNADLGKPLSWTKAKTPAEAAAIIAPYQFVYAPTPERLMGPTITWVDSSPTAGPFGEFREFSPGRRLDGSLLTDPPWSMTTYLGRQHWLGDRGFANYRGGHLRPPTGQHGSITSRTVRSPQRDWRATPATASGAARADRRRPPRD